MMTTEPILCSGNDLARVCADIRARGGLVTSLTTGVGGNAGYKVSYFGGGESTTKACPQSARNRAATTFDGGKTIAPKTPRGTEDSAQTNGSEAQRTHLQDCTAVISDRPGGVESADLGRQDDLSIEDRMAALQERLRASGKLQRSKPSTLIQHARSPYKDD